MSTSHNIYSEDVSIQISPERDQEILNNYLNKNGHINGTKLALSEKFYYKDYIYIKQRYSDSDSFAETIYRLKNGIEEKPVCPICGKPIKYCGKYKKHCSAKCSANDKNTRELCKKTCIEKYGVDNPYKSKEIIEKIKETNLEKYGNTSYVRTQEYREKTIKSNNERYGVDYVSQCNEIKEKIKNTVREKYNVNNISQAEEIKNKKKQSSLKKYGTICTFQGKDVLEKIKKRNLKKYGSENPSSSEYIKRKKIETMKKNHTFGTSKAEELIYLQLIKYFNEVIRQYHSEVYPFQADFYIPELDLYIEYQGTWCHGGHPYDPNNEEDLKRLNYLQNKLNEGHPYYENAIIVWTQKDPLKRETAKDNNINLIEFWNLQEVEDWLNTLK